MLLGCDEEQGTTRQETSGTNTVLEAPKTAADDGCPEDLLAAIGKPCREDGKLCSMKDEPDPRRMLSCTGGHWAELNIPPGPTASP